MVFCTIPLQGIIHIENCQEIVYTAPMWAYRPTESKEREKRKKDPEIPENESTPLAFSHCGREIPLTRSYQWYFNRYESIQK
jgi:hypothetical protein